MRKQSEEGNIFLGLGSNLGDRRVHLAAALRAIGDFARIAAISRVYETQPVGYTDQGPFLNLVVRISTELTPESLLRRIKAIEVEVGRSPSFRNGPREIDIDLLLCGSTQIRGPILDLPHPRMAERAFVLRPMADLAPDLEVPGTGRTVTELLETGGPWEKAEPAFDGSDLLEQDEEGGAR